MILPYETIFSRALGKIDDPKELALNSNDFYEIYTERLHNVLGDARIRRLFSSIVLDDEFQEVSFLLPLFPLLVHKLLNTKPAGRTMFLAHFHVRRHFLQTDLHAMLTTWSKRTSFRRIQHIDR